jgi:pimeloyl-ACP methyl ester carboxylesterase
MTKAALHDETQTRILFFTGLGANQNAFSRLKIPHALKAIHIKWLTSGKKENIQPYCKRLIQAYAIQPTDILIGLSFGGLVVTEIARQVHPALSILISSVSTRKELPPLYRLAGFLHLDQLISSHWLEKSVPLIAFLFNLKTQNQQNLLDEILAGADKTFARWAIHQTLRWKNRTRPDRLYKIHGTNDRILPIHKSSTDFIIEGGTHFLTWEKADEVSTIIQQLIKAN